MPNGLPLSIEDITTWFAFVSVLSLATIEIFNHIRPAQGLVINKMRLRLMAGVTALIVIISIVVRIYYLMS